MKFFAIIGPALAAYFSQQTSFRVGSKLVTITEGGSVAHLTLAVILQAFGMVLAGQTGTIACGVFSVAISDWDAAPTLTAPPDTPEPTTVSEATPRETDVPVGRTAL